VQAESPSTLLASIKTLDAVKMEKALVYIKAIIENPIVPASDKAMFIAIRNDLGRGN